MPRLPPRVNPLVIRLALYGCTNRPFYHIVVMNQKSARNAKAKEQIGTYDPMPNADNEKLVAIDFEKLRYYVANGVSPTKPVAQLLGLAGFFPVHPMSYILAKRHRAAAAKLKSTQDADKDTAAAES